VTTEWNKSSLLELARAFRECRVFLTAVELDIFSHLGNKWKTTAKLAEEIDCDSKSLEVLLNTLVAIGLLLKSENSFKTDPEVASFMSSKSPNSILPLARHQLIFGTLGQN
jgi:DNA-binding IclR family transcriptional regulator